jgi:methionine synthase II (cobalamin-independent)
MSSPEFGCLPTVIGSFPDIDPSRACRLVLRFLKDIPAWPQLPQRSFLENMYAQFSQGFPGLVVGDQKIYVDRAKVDGPALETLYAAYLNNDLDRFPVTGEYAAGLAEFLTHTDLTVKAVKGQITGPVSWGMTVTDGDGKAIAYDEVLADAAAKMLKLKAGWMERQLREISKNTLIFVDEPYLHSIGSAFFNLSQEKIMVWLNEVLSGIQGVKGLHCCGKTDWPLVLRTNLDILSFDTYNYAESLSLYPAEMKKFLVRGGAIAWGIIPNQEDLLKQETAGSLLDRLGEAMAPFTRQGVDLPFRQLIARSLVTPTDGLVGLSADGVERALELLVELSEKARRRWG